MTVVRRNARVPYSAQQMFALVNDIESYPEFLHWCRAARILSRNGNTIDARLDVGVAGIGRSFVTRNTLTEPSEIGVRLLSGPFKRLDGGWKFTDVDGGCDVELLLDFQMKASPFSAVFAAIFEEIARTQMSAFLARADRIYGQNARAR